MKRWIYALAMLLFSTIGYAQNATDSYVSDLSPEDMQLLEYTIQLVDLKMYDDANQNFDLLAKKYPKNFLIAYERIYNLYLQERYKDVIKDGKSLLKSPNVSEAAYQLVGNAYDLIGDRKKSEKTYKEGLKTFPNSGMLYLELGILSMSDNDYNTAINYFTKGIDAQPNFASNYYRAAHIYLSTSTHKVWGLVYAETEILLAPQNKERHQYMANMMLECLKRSIKAEGDGDERSIEVKLVPTRVINASNNNETVYLEFPGVYEGAITNSLTKLLAENAQLSLDIQQLAFIRKGAVEVYYSATDNLYGNSMYLLEYQKQIIDAGHWDAYNYFIFSHCYPEEYEQWVSTHGNKLREFFRWYNEHPFRLGDGRSVSISQIYKTYRPINIIEAFSIQGSLSTGKEIDDVEEEGEEDSLE